MRDSFRRRSVAEMLADPRPIAGGDFDRDDATLQDLRDARGNTLTEIDGILETAHQSNRDLTDDELGQHNALVQRHDQLQRRIDARAETDRPAVPGPNRIDGQGPRRDLSSAATLVRSERVRDWEAARGRIAREDQNLSLGRFIRGIATGDWEDAQAERALAGGTGSAGGFLVPTPLAADVIDLARNRARVFEAGAVTVPMDSATLKVGRIAGDPSPLEWHTESEAIDPSSMTFEQVTFTARSLPCLIKGSIEVFADVGNLNEIVTEALGSAFALELDRVALYGSGTAPEPRGVRNQSGVTITTFGTANGAIPEDYDFLIDTVQVLRGQNHEPNAIIDAPRTETTLAKLKDTTEQPLRVPDMLAEIPRLPTNQVPIDNTVGTSETASDVFVAEWPQLMVGMRTEFMVEFVRERFLDTGQRALFAWLRADIQLARPEAFNVVEGIL